MALAFSPDGKTLAVAKQSMGSFVQLWDLATQKAQKAIAETAGMDQTLSTVFAPQDEALITVGGALRSGNSALLEGRCQ
jgi:WD40 repeat protein